MDFVNNFVSIAISYYGVLHKKLLCWKLQSAQNYFNVLNWGQFSYYIFFLTIKIFTFDWNVDSGGFSNKTFTIWHHLSNIASCSFSLLKNAVALMVLRAPEAIEDRDSAITTAGFSHKISSAIQSRSETSAPAFLSRFCPAVDPVISL